MDKKSMIDHFWNDRVNRYGKDPRSNSNDIWIREVEVNAICAIIEKVKPEKILDFGCANGHSTTKIANKFPHIKIVGCDINENMILSAQKENKLKNLEFICSDVIFQEIGVFDLIVGTRVFQNIDSLHNQVQTAKALFEKSLKPEGHLFFIESYADGYEQINNDRVLFELPKLPILPHLTLLTDEFNIEIEKYMNMLERGSPTSTYYIVTRLVYSKLAQINEESIDYDHLLHKLAAACPQVGEYGPQRSYLYQLKKQ